MNFFISDETFKIDLGEGYFTEFLKEISFKDEMEIHKKDNPMEAGVEKLFRMLKSWNLTNEKGELIELTKENFLNLSPKILTKLLLEVNEVLNKELKDYQEMNDSKKK